MHWWNLIKSACLCSQSDFECHVGWSGHNANIRVALVEDDLNGHPVCLWNRIIIPEANILQSVDIQAWLRTGVNNGDVRNIVLIDHQAAKSNQGEGGGGRNWLLLVEQVAQEDLERCTHARKQCWAALTPPTISAWRADQ